MLRAWETQEKREFLALGTRPGHGLVFTRPDGELFHPDTASTVFDRLVKSSGLPRITLHGLRHTHAVIPLKAGTPVNVVAERLGHSSPQVTLDYYGHVMAGMQATAANAFAAAMAGA